MGRPRIEHPSWGLGAGAAQGAGRDIARPLLGAPADELKQTRTPHVVADASEVAGRDIARLLLDADADELKQTRNAQLATFVLSLVALDAVERVGLVPSACAGHSLGEYTALVAAGALSFEDGVRVV